VIPPSGPPFTAEVIGETARIHERADFDRALIRYFSDASQRTVQRHLTAHNLIGRFDAIVGHGDYDSGKPAPDPFLKAAERAALGWAAIARIIDIIGKPRLGG
jgi:beta-phosphoglucomutase-like phosphatase (HAD superfamily)